MQRMIQYLINHDDVLSKVKEGKASLVGVSSEEQKAIFEVFSEQHANLGSYYYWQ